MSVTGSPSPWAEAGYSRRRALADVLAVLRELMPYPTSGSSRGLSPATRRRLAAALDHRASLASVQVPGVGPLDDALLTFLHLVEAEVDAPSPSPAATLAIPARAGTPAALHEAMLETILGLVGAPAQDL